MEEELLEQIALEEKRYREGKALACDLICLGATNKDIGIVLGSKANITNEWRKELRKKGRAIRDLCEKSEIEGGLQQLAQYRGLYTQEAREARSQKKQEFAQIMIAEGMKRKDIVKKLGVSRTTLSEWEAIWNGERSGIRSSEKVWAEQWQKEWDEFMARLVRPIRLAR